MSLFLSHGAPLLLLDETPAHRFLQRLGRALPRPGALVVVSAHWQSPRLEITSAAAPSLIYDFGGFPDALYRFQWPVKGDPALAAQMASLLEKAGLAPVLNPTRGLDHGVWVPLALMYPEADIPLVQVALPQHADSRALWLLGEQLAGLEQEGVCVIASGSLTHNLAALQMPWQRPEDPRVAQFRQVLDPILESEDRRALTGWQALAQASFHHPSDEHFLPLLVAAAAPGSSRKLHVSTEYGVLAMDAWAFGPHARELAADL